MSKRRTPRYLREPDDRAVPQPGERIAADLSKQASNNSYAGGLLFYEDKPFVCVDCGKEEIWTAKQQQWWYEVAKGPIYSRAIRCHACRAKHKDSSQAGNQPIRSVGHLMKLVRAEIEPAILAAGFVFEGQNKSRPPRERAWIDYKRHGRLFSVVFEPPARLIAELLEENGDCRPVSVTEFDNPRTTLQIKAKLKTFASTVVEFVANLEPTP